MSFKNKLEEAAPVMPGVMRQTTSSITKRTGRKKKPEAERLQKAITFLSRDTLSQIQQQYPSLSQSVAIRLVIEQALRGNS